LLGQQTKKSNTDYRMVRTVSNYSPTSASSQRTVVTTSYSSLSSPAAIRKAHDMLKVYDTIWREATLTGLSSRALENYLLQLHGLQFYFQKWEPSNRLNYDSGRICHLSRIRVSRARVSLIRVS
jgi:hypothetical protein